MRGAARLAALLVFSEMGDVGLPLDMATYFEVPLVPLTWRLMLKRPRRVHLLRDPLNGAFDRLQAGFGLPGALTPVPVFGFELP